MIYVDIVTGVYGEMKDLRILRGPEDYLDALLEEIGENEDLLRLISELFGLPVN